jgi:hypothetical protein
MNFLWKKPKKDDIRPSDFSAGNDGRVKTKNTNKIGGLSIDQLYKNINKKISHLTAARKDVKDEEKKWDVKKISCDIMEHLNSFLSDADLMDIEYKEAITTTINNFRQYYCDNDKQYKYDSISTTASYASASFPVNGGEGAGKYTKNFFQRPEMYANNMKAGNVNGK